AHDDANAILRRKPLISVVPPFISIYTKSFELHQGGNSSTPQAINARWGDRVNVSFSTLTCLEVMAGGVSKGHALEAVAQAMG
ncbi:HAD hydrolase family protein, partial [Salmonella enterica subsp. enterica serovar Anatum]|nr:HAD hydrolase family protein [Salmonella enterica subsp. enterica serovar Anatum]